MEALFLIRVSSLRDFSLAFFSFKKKKVIINALGLAYVSAVSPSQFSLSAFHP